jgi:hypothetical protein
MQHTYNASSKIFQKLLGLDITPKQIERVCTFYGSKLYQMQCGKVLHTDATPGICKKLYVLMDGSFVPIRNTSIANADKGKDCWKEVKLGRLIDQKHMVKGISKDMNYVSSSDYLVHIGNAETFLEQLRLRIESRKYEQLIFICDGAKWIWNWVADTFPNAFQLLDYYHAMEYIAAYGLVFFPEIETRKQWMDLQQERLLADKVSEILEELESEKLYNYTYSSNSKKEALIKLQGYLNENKDRMGYGTCKKQGIEIGSGAIESAHRTIIQQRAKLSGQRWTMNGVQSILSLRAAYHSQRWNEVIKLIRSN